mgnify:CR=1 FL=1
MKSNLKPDQHARDQEDKYLSPREVAETLEEFFKSDNAIRKLELLIKTYVIKPSGISLLELERDIVSEAITKIWEGKRRWPRGINAATMIKQTARSIISGMRAERNADALAIGRRTECPDPSSNSDEWLDSVSVKETINNHHQIANYEDALEAIKNLFSDDPVAYDVLYAVHGMKLKPAEVQTMLSLTATEYETKRRKILRRLADLR